MSIHYPIWVDVTSCIYNSSKSYGIRDTGQQTIRVGSSSKNSIVLADICITKRFVEDKWVFRYSVDNIVIKEAWFEDNNGRPGRQIGSPRLLIDLPKEKERVCF